MQSTHLEGPVVASPSAFCMLLNLVCSRASRLQLSVYSRNFCNQPNFTLHAFSTWTNLLHKCLRLETMHMHNESEMQKHLKSKLPYRCCCIKTSYLNF
jgi:hypothetical protein